MKNIIKETEVAVRFIFMSLAMNVIQLDIKNINNGKFKIKEPYIDQLESMHTLASHECRDLKKVMWDKKISVIIIGKRNDYTEYMFSINGRDETRTYNNHIIRKNVKEILANLMERV